MQMNEGSGKYWMSWCLLAAALVAGLTLTGRTVPERMFDTPSYTEYSFESWSSALSSTRTFGYPLFLKCTASLHSSDGTIVWAQLAMSILATAFFFWALIQCRWDCALACAAASALLFGTIVREYSSVLTPDALAQSLALITVGCWLIAVERPQVSSWSFATGLAAFVTYQTKPAYLFMLLFLPIGAGIARWWLHCDRIESIRFGVRVLLCVWGPFLAWCTLRWMVVGHFGLVSFGGYNIIGIAGQFLEPTDLPKLSTDIRPLASRILEARAALLPQDAAPDNLRIETHFNGVVWQVAVPQANAEYDSDVARVNSGLAKLSRELIAIHRARYLGWLAHAARRALVESLQLLTRDPAVLLSIALAIVAHAVCGWRIANRRDVWNGESAIQSSNREFQTIVWLAFGYAACKLALVILVEPPVSRYVAPATVFFPCIPAMLAVQYLKRSRNKKPAS